MPRPIESRHPEGAPQDLLDYVVDDIYLVEDDDGVAGAVQRYLDRMGYDVTVFPEGPPALDAIRRAPPGLLITDYYLPGMNGVELARKAQETDPEIGIILFTGGDDPAIAQAAVRLEVADFLKKPLDMAHLEQAVRKAVFNRAGAAYSRAVQSWLREEVERKTDELHDLTLGALSSLVRALESRNEHFRAHSQNVAIFAAQLARAMELPEEEVQEIRTAGLLHDVGMIAVPDAIITMPEALTPEQYRILRTHCEKGAEILEPLPGFDKAIRYIREHHERMDGSGYPRGLVGDQISLGGQVLGLAETWVALSEPRAFRPRADRDEALEIVLQSEGQWYSAPVIQAFRRVERV